MNKTNKFKGNKNYYQGKVQKYFNMRVQDYRAMQLKERQYKLRHSKNKNKGMTISIKKDLAVAKRFRSQGKLKLSYKWENRAIQKLVKNKNTDISNIMEIMNRKVIAKKKSKISFKENGRNWKYLFSGYARSKIIEGIALRPENIKLMVKNSMNKRTLNQTLIEIGRKMKLNVSAVLYDNLKEEYEKAGGQQAANQPLANQSNEIKSWFIKFRALDNVYNRIDKAMQNVIKNNRKPKTKFEKKLVKQYVKQYKKYAKKKKAKTI